MDNADKFLKALLNAQFGEQKKTAAEVRKDAVQELGSQFMSLLVGLKNSGFTHDEAFQILLRMIPVTINN